MISSVIAKSFHIHVLHNMILKSGETNKIGIIRIFQIKKMEEFNSFAQDYSKW